MTELLDELSEEIPVSEGNRTINVSKQKAIVKILVWRLWGETCGPRFCSPPSVFEKEAIEPMMKRRTRQLTTATSWRPS